VCFDGTLKHRLIHKSDIMFGGAGEIFGSCSEPDVACTSICSSGSALFKSGHVTGPSGRPRNEGFISRDEGGAEVPQVNTHEGVEPLRTGNRK